MNDDFLQKKLKERIANDSLRSLKLNEGKIDFCSNDYLGVVKDNLLSVAPADRWNRADGCATGSTGSRLLAGNYALIEETENFIAQFHQAEAGLIFNSGYDANLGLLSCVPQRGDTILYDALSHASIRDGIRLSFAQAHAFEHNNLNHLENQLQQIKQGSIFVVTESVFSMDGDTAPLISMSQLCEKFNAKLIVDEAHATGIIGEKGEGLVQQLNLQQQIFARIHTFGKALGCHGAIVLGSQVLKNYLINFSRAFIYATALPPKSVADILQSYKIFPQLINERKKLNELIQLFQTTNLAYSKLISNTAIQGVLVEGNEQARMLAKQLQQQNIDVRPILYPTVPKGKERLRIVLHSFNNENELKLLLNSLNSIWLK